jgi:hypothetical protein
MSLDRLSEGLKSEIASRGRVVMEG